mgnify:CR=1 FL=1
MLQEPNDAVKIVVLADPHAVSFQAQVNRRNIDEKDHNFLEFHGSVQVCPGEERFEFRKVMKTLCIVFTEPLK